MKRMWKNVLCFWLILLFFLLSACENTLAEPSEAVMLCALNNPDLTTISDSFPNLNTSTMTISVPDVENLHQVRLSFNASRVDPNEIVERFFEKAKEHYGLSELDESAIYCAVAGPDAYLWYPYAKMKNNLNNAELKFMKYEDDSHFFLYYIHALAEWFDVPLLRRLVGLEKHTPFGWRPYDMEPYSLAGTYAQEDLLRDNISYPLLDGEMSLKQAFEIEKNTFVPGFCELPVFLDVEPERIEVYEIGGEQYGYYGYGRYLYQGVPLISVPGATILASDDARFNKKMTPEDGKYHILYTSRAHSFIMSQDGVCWAWVYCYDQDETTETYSQVLSLNSALQQLSRMLSEYATMDISSAELLYASEQIYEDQGMYEQSQDYVVNLFPVWEFKVSNPGVNELSELTCYVDARTGSVTLYGFAQ